MESESTTVTRTETTNNRQEMARRAAQDLGKNVRQVRDQTRDALSNWENLPAHEFLIIIGGLVALGLGTLLWFFGLAGVAVWGAPAAALATLWWLMNIIFGFLVLFSYGMYKRSTNGALLGFIFALILAVAGGASGLIGGIMAMIGFGWALWNSGQFRMSTSPPTS